MEETEQLTNQMMMTQQEYKPLTKRAKLVDQGKNQNYAYVLLK